MRKKSLKSGLIFLATLPFFLGSAGPASGALQNEAYASPTYSRLAVNRTLLIRYEKERWELEKELKRAPSALLRRKIEGAGYKIKAVKDDMVRLESLLTPKERANEFIKDLLCQHEFAEKPFVSYSSSAEGASGPGRSKSSDEAAAKRSREKVLKSAAFSDSRNAEHLNELHEQALSLVAQSRFKDAEAIYQEILLLNPDDDQAYIILGHVYLLSGEYEKAETSFHNAIHIDSQNINDITPFYESLIMKNPSDDMAYTHLGYAYLMLDRVSEAKRAFEDALQINPDNFPARNGLGILGRPA